MAKSKRKCTGCKKHYPVEQIEIDRGVVAFHTVECYVEYRRREQEKARLKQISKLYLNKGAPRKTGLSNQRDLTQKAFNKMRVLQEMIWFKERGLEPYCISCLKTNMDWCCGHFKTRGAQPELALDEKNTYLQCNKYCNESLSGNIEGNKSTIGYKAGLAHRFGSEKAREIIDYLESNHDPKRFREDDYKKLRAEFNRKSREMARKLQEM